MAVCGGPHRIYRVFKFWPIFVGENDTKMSCNGKTVNTSLKSENTKCDKHERTNFLVHFSDFCSWKNIGD